MATINAAEWHGLKDIGCLAPSKLADIVILSDLENVKVKSVYIEGEHVAENGKLLIAIPSYTYPDFVKHSISRDPVVTDDLRIPAKGSSAVVRVIKLIEFTITTEQMYSELPVENGYVVPSVDSDVLPIVVVGRYSKNGPIGRAFVHGFNLEIGAIA